MADVERNNTNFGVTCIGAGEICGRTISATPEDIQQVIISENGASAEYYAAVPALQSCPRPDCGEALSKGTTTNPTLISLLQEVVASEVVICEDVTSLVARRFGKQYKSILFEL